MSHYTCFSFSVCTNQLADSEILCNEGRQDFDLTTAGFAEATLGLCLSALVPCNSLHCSASMQINDEDKNFQNRR